MKTFGQIAEQRLKDQTFDWAIPQPVFNKISDITNQNPSGHVVWLYDKQASVFGRPFGLTLLGDILLRISGLIE